MWGMMSLQDANSPIMENMIMFHDFGMLILLIIMIMVMYVMNFMWMNYFTNRMLMNNQVLEIIWTLIPMVLLIFLAIPSLKILYMSDEMNMPNLSIKVIGHQWYWSYEYSDFNKVVFDSFMMNEGDLSIFRLLDVDNRVILPISNQIRMLINSSDVIHSFAVPSLGVKVDAVPGRMNQISMLLKRPGVFFGQCSEICGVNHSFMPIVIEASSINNFMSWVKGF